MKRVTKCPNKLVGGLLHQCVEEVSVLFLLGPAAKKFHNKLLNDRRASGVASCREGDVLYVSFSLCEMFRILKVMYFLIKSEVQSPMKCLEVGR